MDLLVSFEKGEIGKASLGAFYGITGCKNLLIGEFFTEGFKVIIRFETREIR